MKTGVVIQIVKFGASHVGEAGHLRTPHRVAFVMLGGDDEVFHARRLRRADDGGGVEVGRVEVSGDLRLVVGLAPAFSGEGPFAVAEKGIRAEVDEHAETRVRPPRHFGGDAVVSASGRACQQHDGANARED